MTFRRALLVLIALTMVAPASAALAAPAARKTVCNLISDVDGDGGLRATTYGPVNVNSAPMDILGGDIATGPKNVVAVIKVASFDADPQALTAITYSFFFRVKTTEYSFSLRRTVQGEEEFSFSGGAVTGVVNQSAKTITFTTSRTNVKPLSAKGQKITELRISTKASAGNADTTNVDPKFAYVDRTPSCLKPA